MADNSIDPHVEELLLREVVSSIVFIHNYVQVVFHDYTTINLYNPVTARRSGAELRAGLTGFADALVSFIGSKASSVSVDTDEFIIHFGSDSIAVSLRPDSYVGPEALSIHGSDHSIWAWQPMLPNNALQLTRRRTGACLDYQLSGGRSGIDSPAARRLYHSVHGRRAAERHVRQAAERTVWWRKQDWCCTGFQARFSEAGERGVAIFVDDAERPARFILQHRSVEPGAPLSDNEGPVTLVADLVIQFCPFCGANLDRWYRRSLHKLARPDLPVRAGGSAA